MSYSFDEEDKNKGEQYSSRNNLKKEFINQRNLAREFFNELKSYKEVLSHKSLKNDDAIIGYLGDLTVIRNKMNSSYKTLIEKIANKNNQIPLIEIEHTQLISRVSGEMEKIIEGLPFLRIPKETPKEILDEINAYKMTLPEKLKEAEKKFSSIGRGGNMGVSV